MRTSVWRLMCAGLFASAPSAWAQTADVALPVRAGDTAITGFISPVPAMATSVTLEVTALNPNGSSRVVTRQQAMTAPGTGAFSFTIPVGVLRARYQLALSDSGTKTALGQALVDGLQQPVLRGPVSAGTRAIEGTAGPRMKVRVTVRPPFRPTRDDVNLYLQQADATADDNGRFQLVLPSPVLGGQDVDAVTISAVGQVESEPAHITVSDPGDWGRTRAYFAGGVVLSKRRGNFSEQDLAMTFALDKSWFQTQAMTLPPDEDSIQVSQTKAGAAARVAAAGDEETKKPRAWYRPRQFNTFFDTRLTALPVKQSTTTASTTTPAGGAAQPTVTVPSTDQFIASQKGAVMQIGTYAPLYGPKTSWIHQAQVNTLFVAPVLRFGIQTITEDPESQTTTSASPTGSTTAVKTAVATALDQDDVFHFWSAGLGVGHYRLTGTRNEAPELISYLHITLGRSEAFESQGTNGTSLNPTRWFIEGRLKIPDTALQVGFDANLGKGNDDVRFVFGTRFDLGAVIGRMRQLN